MSTTPNQKDLLAKKSDLEGILKPDDNDVLHLPGVTITLAESGQFYLAGIDKKLLTLIGNTSGNAVTLDGDAGLTFTTSGGSSTITGITSSNGNSTSLAASQSMVSAKQDRLTAGTNITIENNVISAQGGGSDVSITPTLATGTKIADFEIDGVSGSLYAPQGGGTASAMSDLTDVDLTNLANGQVLKYNSTTEKWENTNESGGGSSGGGGYKETLWSGNATPTTTSPITITLNHAYNDYDLIIFNAEGASNDYKFSTIIDTNVINIGDDYIELVDSAQYLYVYVGIDSNTSMTLKGYSSSWGATTTYTSIVGVKLSEGSGGGSAGGVDTLWTGDVCPYVNGNTDITLDYPYTDYDYILVNTYDTNYNMYGTSIFYDLKANYSYEDTIDSQGDVRNILMFQVLGDTSIRLKNYGQLGQCTHYVGFYGVKLGGSGGSSEITYSTTEHRVGTWIDGSDVYEKTINLTGTYQGDSAIDISSYLIGNENIIESAGYLSYVYSGSTYIQPINGYYANLEYRVNKYQLKLSLGSGSSFSMDAYITIRYTKVSS